MPLIEEHKMPLHQAKLESGTNAGLKRQCGDACSNIKSTVPEAKGQCTGNLFKRASDAN